MTIALWVLHGLAILIYGASGVMKTLYFDKVSEGVKSFGALPRRVWTALGILELTCVAGLIATALLPAHRALAAIPAAILSLESLVFIRVHVKYRETPTIIMSAVLGILMTLLAIGCARPTAAPAHHDPDGTYLGRPIAMTMSYRGAAWLDRADRAERERPEVVIDALALTPASVVADVGAGTGYFTTRIAPHVATVHATDLQPEMLEMLHAHVVEQHLTNVVTHEATDHDAGLPAACCDVVLMVDVYHELSDPAGVLASIRRALRPGGRLVLVEYRGEDPAVAIKPEHKTTLAQLQRELAANAFTFRDSVETLPDQRIVTFVAAP